MEANIASLPLQRGYLGHSKSGSARARATHVVPTCKAGKRQQQLLEAERREGRLVPPSTTSEVTCGSPPPPTKTTAPPPPPVLCILGKVLAVCVLSHEVSKSGLSIWQFGIPSAELSTPAPAVLLALRCVPHAALPASDTAPRAMHTTQNWRPWPTAVVVGTPWTVRLQRALRAPPCSCLSRYTCDRIRDALSCRRVQDTARSAV